MAPENRSSDKSSFAWWSGFIALAVVLNFGENILAVFILGIFLLQLVAPLMAWQPTWEMAICTAIGFFLFSTVLIIPIGAINVIFASKLSKQHRGRAAKILGTVGGIMWFGWGCCLGSSLLQPGAMSDEPTLGTIEQIWLPICLLLNAVGQIWAAREVYKGR